jgi:hypothetical protein
MELEVQSVQISSIILSMLTHPMRKYSKIKFTFMFNLRVDNSGTNNLIIP